MKTMISDYHNPTKYAYRVEKYPNYIVIKKEWYLWRAKWAYAIILHELLWYSIGHQWKDIYVWTSNLDCLRKKLDDNNLSYVCINKGQCLFESPDLSDQNLKLIREVEDIEFDNI